MINKAVCMKQCSNVLITQLSCSNSLSLFCIYFWDQQSGQDKLSQAPLPSSSSDCTCSQEPNSSFFIDCFTQSQHFLHFPRWWGPHWPPIGRAQFAPPIGAQWAGLSSSWRDLEEVILTASTASHPGQPGPPSAKKVNLNNRFCSATTFSQSSGRPAGLGGTDSDSNNSDINNNNIAISIVSQPHQCTQQTLV